MPSAKGRARLFAGERPVKELDPEAEAPLEDEDDASESEDGKDAVGADTDHYVAVGKSKLRQKQALDMEDDEEVEGEVDQKTAKAQAETRKILAEERQHMLAPISQSAKADADKGFAVRQQRRTFDALLNMRIRMQKALTASNSLHVAAEEGRAMDAAVAESTAAEAIALLASIQSIRQSFYIGTETSTTDPKQKRKRSDNDDRSCETIFRQMAETEEAAQGKRRRVLDRWAMRVQRPSASGAGSASVSKRFQPSTGTQALTVVLDEQLATAEDRLVRRTRVPRSCAPVQAARRVAEDAEIYDDADFYQLLLKELVDQRTTDSSAPGNALPTVRWAASAVKEAKTRKLVDRKASKGRKMRFNVHEKLQNFMAPEDRRQWEPEAIDRLFGTIFGQRAELHEDDGDDGDNGSDNGVSPEEEGLRLFRS
ncbi:vesicle-mediated transport protein [Grosmannia clavigera kw1407]|uniref:Protein BFR2 n=1 Tax=Grosmannia clavigera (strain kw1407 / UAMH 11150) TaxID=655863 RepID=F0XBZ5_GROCL|nr:vesicle-mediated transport protein [Grosmannia clavigera kw1407]EFX04026.1 vesicle-mediated transport protein [Grosmannia clavigera kw1407]